MKKICGTSWKWNIGIKLFQKCTFLLENEKQNYDFFSNYESFQHLTPHKLPLIQTSVVHFDNIHVAAVPFDSVTSHNVGCNNAHGKFRAILLIQSRDKAPECCLINFRKLNPQKYSQSREWQTLKWNISLPEPDCCSKELIMHEHKYVYAR